MYVSRRDLSEAERKAMLQLDDIRSQLLNKETELSLLHGDINMLAADRDNKILELEGKGKWKLSKSLLIPLINFLSSA